LRVEITEIKYEIYVCPQCKMFLTKDTNKIPDSCPRCKTRITKFDDPTPRYTKFHNVKLENLNDPYDNY